MKKAILCVDDEHIILTSLRDQLTDYFGDRYLYEFAQSAEEAWEILGEFEEDAVDVLIIVSDWLMPGIRGDEFLVQLHQKFPAIVKMMLTGQADEAAIQRVKVEADLYCLLTKPWEKNELLCKIENAITTLA